MTQLIPIEATINGRARSLQVAAHHTLLDVLRDDLALTGTKECCLVGECGACTVRLNDQIVDSCLVLAVEADGGTITTVEGLAAADGQLAPIQQAFLDYGAAQCGFCIPGQLMAADDLLRRVTEPTLEDVQEGLAGNLCRCAGYEQIMESVQAVAAGLVDPSRSMAVDAAAGAGGARAGARTSAEGLDQ
jgi:aerobic carbon-monoxide dehydrogenase small subunit